MNNWNILSDMTIKIFEQTWFHCVHSAFFFSFHYYLSHLKRDQTFAICSNEKTVVTIKNRKPINTIHRTTTNKANKDNFTITKFWFSSFWAATLYQVKGNHIRIYKIRDIRSTGRYILHMKLLLECLTTLLVICKDCKRSQPQLYS
jgi:hypothetical protein